MTAPVLPAPAVDDAAARAPFTPTEARERTDLANRTLETFQQQVIELYEGRADEVLGYGSWPEYVRTEFTMLPRMGRLERRDAVRELSAAGMSQRDVAAVVGVGHETVGRDLRGSNEPERSTDAPGVADLADQNRSQRSTEAPPVAKTPDPPRVSPKDSPGEEGADRPAGPTVPTPDPRDGTVSEDCRPQDRPGTATPSEPERPKPPKWDPEERKAHEAEVNRKRDIEAARRQSQTIVTEVLTAVVTVVTGCRYGERGLVTREMVAEIRKAIDLLEGEIDDAQ